MGRLAAWTARHSASTMATPCGPQLASTGPPTTTDRALPSPTDASSRRDRPPFAPVVTPEPLAAKIQPFAGDGQGSRADRQALDREPFGSGRGLQAEGDVGGLQPFALDPDPTVLDPHPVPVERRPGSESHRFDGFVSSGQLARRDVERDRPAWLAGDQLLLPARECGRAVDREFSVEREPDPAARSSGRRRRRARFRRGRRQRKACGDVHLRVTAVDSETQLSAVGGAVGGAVRGARSPRRTDRARQYRRDR